MQISLGTRPEGHASGPGEMRHCLQVLGTLTRPRSQRRRRGVKLTPGFALRRLPLGVVNDVHLRDVRGEDLDLSPTTAQVYQRAVWETTKADSEMCPTQLHVLTRF